MPKQKFLPPDPENQNTDRAQWAGVAIAAFMAETGCDQYDALPDLLCNLMHWADRNDIGPLGTFPLALLRAKAHYREETQPDPDEAAYLCQGCGRPEGECSLDPCAGVIADREE